MIHKRVEAGRNYLNSRQTLFHGQSGDTFMGTLKFYAFVAALLAFGFAGPASAEGDCLGGYEP